MRRDFIFSMGAMLALTAGMATAQVNDAPLTEGWAPSEWGADDLVGSVNRTTPEMVLKAVGLVKQGKVATLGKVYAGDVPAFGSRGWRMTIPGLPTGGPFGSHQLVYNDEYLATEIGQIGTQLDGPGHIGVITSEGMFFYNGRILETDPGISAYGLGPARCGARGRDRFRLPGRPAQCGRAQGWRSADTGGERSLRSRHCHGRGHRDDGRGNGHRPDWRGRLRVPAYRARRHLASRRLEQVRRGREGRADGELQRRRAGLRHLRLRIPRRPRDHPDRGRHVVGRGGAGRERRQAVRVPSPDADPARDLEHREPRSDAARRGRGGRVPLRLVAAQNAGRDRISGQSRGLSAVVRVGWGGGVGGMSPRLRPTVELR